MSVMGAMPRRLTGALVLLAGLGLFLSGAAVARTGQGAAATDGRAYHAAEWRGASPGFGMVVRSDDSPQSTSSVSWSNLPGMTVKYIVNESATKDQDLLITYSDNHKCIQNPPVTAFCFVRILVDGVPATPAEVVLDSVQHAANSADVIPFATHTSQFVSGPYGPGPHFVTVQWKVHEMNATFQSANRTLSVMGFHNNAVNVINP